MANYKIDRIESDILKYLSSIINNETDDKLMKTITLTDVSLSKDLSYAKIFFTSISDMEHSILEKGTLKDLEYGEKTENHGK